MEKEDSGGETKKMNEDSGSSTIPETQRYITQDDFELIESIVSTVLGDGWVVHIQWGDQDTITKERRLNSAFWLCSGILCGWGSIAVLGILGLL